MAETWPSVKAAAQRAHAYTVGRLRIPPTPRLMQHVICLTADALKDSLRAYRAPQLMWWDLLAAGIADRFTDAVCQDIFAACMDHRCIWSPPWRYIDNAMCKAYSETPRDWCCRSPDGGPPPTPRDLHDVTRRFLQHIQRCPTAPAEYLAVSEALLACGAPATPDDMQDAADLIAVFDAAQNGGAHAVIRLAAQAAASAGRTELCLAILYVVIAVRSIEAHPPKADFPAAVSRLTCVNLQSAVVHCVRRWRGTYDVGDTYNLLMAASAAAAWAGHVQTATVLHNTHLSLVDPERKTVLTIHIMLVAAGCNNVHIMNMVQQTAASYATPSDFALWRQPAAWAAASCGATDTLRVLLEQNERNDAGWDAAAFNAALLRAAAGHGHVACCQMLRACPKTAKQLASAFALETWRGGDYAIAAAARGGHMDVLRALFEGAGPGVPKKTVRDALLEAASQGQTEIFDALREYHDLIPAAYADVIVTGGAAWRQWRLAAWGLRRVRLSDAMAACECLVAMWWMTPAAARDVAAFESELPGMARVLGTPPEPTHTPVAFELCGYLLGGLAEQIPLEADMPKTEQAAEAAAALAVRLPRTSTRELMLTLESPDFPRNLQAGNWTMRRALVLNRHAGRGRTRAKIRAALGK